MDDAKLMAAEHTVEASVVGQLPAAPFHKNPDNLVDKRTLIRSEIERKYMTRNNSSMNMPLSGVMKAP